MRNYRFLFSLVLLFACLQAEAQKHQIIPQPNEITLEANSKISIHEGMTVSTPGGSEWDLVNLYLVEKLQALGIQASSAKNREGAKVHVMFMLDMDALAAPEGYRLRITEAGERHPNGAVQVASKNAAGAFYAAQTLLQLIEDQMITVGDIKDAPRFPYRGMHLDVSRHFFPVSFIKQYIDLLAEAKMNTFHWHLTDDQGWRIEILQYPKLQEISAWRKETLKGHYNDQPHQFDKKRYGGYYTQEEVREVVKYAKSRFVTIIPEIEMPGHAQAVLAAYPELSCNQKPIETATKWGIFEDVFCAREETFVFLENVLTEVIDLFPGTYIHIGGDECPKERWKTCATCQQRIKDLKLKNEDELQSYFIKRMERFINSKDRKIIGWDEILEGGLAPGATVMSWRGTEGGITAAKAGHDVVMTPGSHCYFDHYQSDSPNEPLAIGGLNPIEKTYSYEPIPAGLDFAQAKHILGAQGNVWTEYMPTTEQVLYMATARMQAMAEVGWTKPEKKNLPDFLRRLEVQFQRWDARKITYANKLHDVKALVKAGDGMGARLVLSTPAGTQPITYQGGAFGKSPVAYSSEVQLTDAVQITATAHPKSGAAQIKFEPHKGNKAKVYLHPSKSNKYRASGDGSPFNGVNGSDTRYGDTEWLGYLAQDFVAELSWDTEQEISQLDFRFFHAPGQWIYAPAMIEVPNPEDTSKPYGSTAVKSGKGKIVEKTVKFSPVKTRKLLIKVSNFGKIPEGAQGAGHGAWLFVDEVRIK
jgi:hexosaminidase